jgi:hypothetical protein
MQTIDVSGGNSIAEINRKQKLARALSQQALASKPQTEFQALASVLAAGLNEYSANKLEKEKPAAYAKLADALTSGKMDLANLSEQVGADVALPLYMQQKKMEYDAAKPKLTVANDAQGNPIIVDKATGKYRIAQEYGQQAAPVNQGIQVQDLPLMTGGQPSGNIDDLVRQQLEAGGFAPKGGFSGGGSPNIAMPPQLPARIPDTQFTNHPQMMQIPYPDTTGNPRATQKKIDAQIENAQIANRPLSPEEQQKRLSDYSKLDLGVKQLEQDSQIVSDNIDRAIALLESGKAGGFKSAVGSWVPNSPTGELAGVLETVKGSNIINTLQNIRNSNPTGGAFGNQSDSENKFIGASKGILDPNQSELTLRNLKVMKANLPLTLKNRREALAKTFPDLYQQQQTDSSNNSANSVKTIKWDELP